LQYVCFSKQEQHGRAGGQADGKEWRQMELLDAHSTTEEVD